MTSQIDNLIKYFGEGEIQKEEEKETIDKNDNQKVFSKHITLNINNKSQNKNGIQNSSNLLIKDILNSNIPIYNNLIHTGNEEQEEKKEINLKNLLENKALLKNLEKRHSVVLKTKTIKAKPIIFEDDNENENDDNSENSDSEKEKEKEKEKEISKDDNFKDDYYMRDRTYSFRPKKIPNTPKINKKEEEVNDFKIDNNEKSQDVENNLPLHLFTETIKTKIENNDNLITLQDQITENKQKNINLIILQDQITYNKQNNIINSDISNDINLNINNRSQSFDDERKEEENNDNKIDNNKIDNNDSNDYNNKIDNNKKNDGSDSDDNTYKEEEDFLLKEELKRNKVEITIKNKEEKEEKVADVIEEKKEEEEEDKEHDEDEEDKKKKKEEEEAQKIYLEEQDKKKI